MPKLHPVVKAFCTTGQRFPDILEQVSCPGDAMVQALKKMQEAETGRISVEEGGRIAQSTALKGVDPNLAILFLWGWARISFTIKVCL